MEEDLLFPQTKQLSTDELLVRAYGNTLIDEDSRFTKLQIRDMPIMITEDDKILCIPYSEETKHIGCTGMTGTSKSLSMNAMLSWDYWLFKNRCVILNDYQRDTFDWSLPSSSQNYLSDIINSNPMPSPLVYIFPLTKTTRISREDRKFPYMKMTLPMSEVISNIESYFPLGKSAVYVQNLLEDLKTCHSMREINSVIESRIRKHELMKFKIMSIIKNIFDNKILNISSPEAPSRLWYNDKVSKEYSSYPPLVLMRAGFIPSIQTSVLSTYDFFSAYMTFIINSIYDAQYNDPFFAGNNLKVSMYVDEITKMWMGHNGKIVKQALGQIGTNGRMARIALRWATQHYEEVPDSIRSNTKYLIVSRKADAKEVREIGKDFHIPKTLADEILQLKTDPKNGIFEVVALTTEKFVLYDMATGAKSQTSEGRKGYLIPPQARHKVPGVMI